MSLYPPREAWAHGSPRGFGNGAVMRRRAWSGLLAPSDRQTDPGTDLRE